MTAPAGTIGGMGSPTHPVYLRVLADLRAQIRDGVLAPGARVPSRNAIIARYGVGETAAKHALQVLAATRDRLSTTLSPADLAQLSYDPYGLTQLPPDIISAAPSFGQGDNLFSSSDGMFRIIFVKARGDLNGYRECTEWLASVSEVARGFDVTSDSAWARRGASSG